MTRDADEGVAMTTKAIICEEPPRYEIKIGDSTFRGCELREKWNGMAEFHVPIGQGGGRLIVDWPDDVVGEILGTVFGGKEPTPQEAEVVKVSPSLLGRMQKA